MYARRETDLNHSMAAFKASSKCNTARTYSDNFRFAATAAAEEAAAAAAAATAAASTAAAAITTATS